MSTSIKRTLVKIVGSIAMAALVLVGVFGFGSPAQAQTATTTSTTTATVISAPDIAALQAQIVQLTALVQNLQAQIAAKGGATSGTCYPFTTGMMIKVGSKGSDVITLQRFLIDKGYLNIPTATDYFGSLTSAALKKYQKAEGLTGSSYGIFDDATKIKISMACGGITTPPVTPPVGTTTPPVTTGNPTITSFSPATATPGSIVTINGTGFGSGNATVYLTGPNGNMTISNVNSISGGPGLSFTLPLTNTETSMCTGSFTSSNCSNYLTPGTYTVNVKNPGGISSNYMTLAVTAYNANATTTSPATTTPSTGTTTPSTASTTPTITSLSTNSGGVGSTVTITGTGFAPSGNTVTFGTATISALTSTNNGTTLQFVVPGISGGNTIMQAGNYNISVNNGTASSGTMVFSLI